MTECVIAALGGVDHRSLNNMAKSPPSNLPEESRNP